MADVKINDHSAEYLNEVDKALDAALEAIGIHLEGEAKELLTTRNMPHKTGDPLNRPNVDTGLLRNSITYALDGEAPATATYKADKGGESGSYSGVAPKESGKSRSVIIGTNVEYAIYIHEGTTRTPANRFLKDAADQNKDQVQEYIKKAMS